MDEIHDNHQLGVMNALFLQAIYDTVKKFTNLNGDNQPSLALIHTSFINMLIIYTMTMLMQNNVLNKEQTVILMDGIKAVLMEIDDIILNDSSDQTLSECVIDAIEDFWKYEKMIKKLELEKPV